MTLTIEEQKQKRVMYNQKYVSTHRTQVNEKVRRFASKNREICNTRRKIYYNKLQIRNEEDKTSEKCQKHLQKLLVLEERLVYLLECKKQAQIAQEENEII